MSDLMNNFRQTIYTVRRWVAAKTAPVRTIFAPLTTGWGKLTAPARHRWLAFRQRNPKVGFVLGWTGWAIKWGIFALFLLVFSVWAGMFGRLPDAAELRSIENPIATEVYTMDSVLIGKYFIENRTDIAIENVSPYIVSALIATEDRRFSGAPWY